MGEKLVVGPVNRGLRTDRTAFVIDNDSFPTLINAYQWRGRVKRKRGTSLLNRLTRFFNSTSISYNPGSSTITLADDGSGNGTGNLLTGFTSLQTNASLVIGSIHITDTTDGQTYTDSNGILTGNSGGTGTVNYATGAIFITGAAGHLITATFLYYPTLPVMGLEDLVLQSTEFPGTLAFDTKYSYNISTSLPYSIYDVSFYKNPPTGTYPGYVQKTNPTPLTWNGADYQQFWTVNYQGALWATNGIDIPFTGTTIGMQFKTITNIAFIAPGPPATCVLTIASHGLVVGDFIFVNEVPNAVVTGINFQTGYVVNVLSINTFTVEFPNATLGGPGGATASGIAQYLTSTAIPGKDCIRWYDGDPTNGNATNPSFLAGKGWVNFAPPLSQDIFSIADLPEAKYYLVGARIIVAFKDRLLFFGVVVQSSSGPPLYLQDTVVYSQNGTPYYTCSYTNTPDATKDTPASASNVFTPILVPINQTATSPAFIEDQTGFGGSLPAGVSQPITGVGRNEDALIVQFNNLSTRMLYTGDDLVPFNFFIINSEFGCSSVFSVITMDQGVLVRSNRGFTTTSQTSSARIDLEIPDQSFQINLLNNGAERITAQRDFIKEWIYFTYASNENTYKFPTETLQFNYRDNSWAIFKETYTTYGQFKKFTGFTWLTVPWTWNSWASPWNAGTSNLLQPKVIAGNAQGFVLERDDGTDEGNSLAIQNISASVVTSPNHCLNDGDYIVISGVLGTIGTAVNGLIFSVSNPSQNTFTLDPLIGSGTYLGGGLIQRMYLPLIQTKQFPMAWGMARKTRIGPQQYLFTKTTLGQIQLLIFLSQNSSFAYNDPDAVNNGSLIYTATLYTCPESTNLGLTPANINLQTPTASDQEQIWHRMNTSLLGDTVQIGFTLSDMQMRDPDFNNQFSEIELHSFILDVSPSQLLA